MTDFDKAVLVTGGAQGIGKAIVMACLEKGWGAAALDVDGEALAALAREAGAGKALLTVEATNHDEAGVAGAVAAAATRFGGLSG
ncbi:MAG: SDR family NAD(P)-dependent oxidoreductase, partial [Proteobacteria bacterium]|nr:SDR family NAD(P)-dependent oxidoreductase [Pseudomonadota bacterium]